MPLIRVDRRLNEVSIPCLVRAESIRKEFKNKLLRPKMIRPNVMKFLSNINFCSRDILKSKNMTLSYVHIHTNLLSKLMTMPYPNHET